MIFTVNCHFVFLPCSTAKFKFLLMLKRHARDISHSVRSVSVLLIFFQVFNITDTYSVYLLSDFVFAILVSNYLNNALKRSIKIYLNTKEIHMTNSGQTL